MKIAPFIWAAVGYLGPQIACPGSVPVCRMIYGLAGAAICFLVSGMWVWGGHLPVRGVTFEPPQQQPYREPYRGPYQAPGYDAWANGQRDRAREMWLQGMGDQVPPTDWWPR